MRSPETQAWKHKIIVLPGWQQDRPAEADDGSADEFDTLVQIQTCQGFDMQPFEIGCPPAAFRSRFRVFWRCPAVRHGARRIAAA